MGDGCEIRSGGEISMISRHQDDDHLWRKFAW